jgi:hypothetical protein
MFVASYTIDFSFLLRMITVSEMVTRQIQTSLSACFRAGYAYQASQKEKR